MMGTIISCCVCCATHCSDRYRAWKWTDYANPGGEFPVNSLTISETHARPTSSIFVAIQEKNSSEVLRHLTDDKTSQVRTSVNSSQESPLHLACRLGYLTIATLLLDHGCRANIVTKIGTPIHCLVKAIKCDYISSDMGLELIPKLMDTGCDIDSLDHKEQTALYQAVCQTDESCIRGLLDLGSSCDIAESLNGFTPLHMAAYQGHIGCMYALLQFPGTALNKLDHQGRTPLVIALLNVMECVQHEPWPNLLYTEEAVRTEPVFRQRYKRVAMVEAVLMAGADANIADLHGRNPMIIAHGLLAMEMFRYGSVMGYTSPADKPRSRSCYEALPSPPSDSETTKESLFAPMVRLLVMFGGRFPESHQQTSFMKCADWMEKLYEDSLGPPPGAATAGKSPEKLVHICRLAIRCCLGKLARLHCVEELPLPDNLLKYVQVVYI